MLSCDLPADSEFWGSGRTLKALAEGGYFTQEGERGREKEGEEGEEEVGE